MDKKQTSQPPNIVAHIYTEALNLINGIRWVDQSGPQKAANLAWRARATLRAVDPSGLHPEIMSAFLKLREQIAIATKGSFVQVVMMGRRPCVRVRWRVSPIEEALESFKRAVEHALPAAGEQVTQQNPAAEGRPTKLPDAAEMAYQSFQLAEQKAERKSEGRLKDRAAYEWLQEQELGQYKLPSSFETWQRYVRQGRKRHKAQKNQPRAGRSGRSIVRPEDIDCHDRIE